MKKLSVAFIGLLLHLTLNVTAQSYLTEPHCGVDEMQAIHAKNDPDYEIRLQKTEAIMQHYMATHKNQPREVITIPVVVHVVHKDEAVVNSITEALIQSQIDILNRDFSKTNYDIDHLPVEFMNRSVDTDIRFCLARQSPDGLASSGIVRKFGTNADNYYIIDNDGNNSLSVKGTVKGSPAWNNTQYLNIWVCDLRVYDFTTTPTSISDNILGVGEFPNSLPAGQQWQDGVMVDYQYFGLPNVSPIIRGKIERNMGRTLTHEVGHYLNLRHLWGNIAGSLNNLGVLVGDGTCSDDDLCNDTPIQMRQNYGLPTFPHLSVPPCTGGEPAEGNMFMNYMDYSDDKALIAFTQDQKERMHTAITSFRGGLKTSQGCTFGSTTRGCVIGTNVSNAVYAETAVNYATVIHWMKSQSPNYEVWYKTQSASSWSVAPTTDNQYTLTGLYATEPYQVKIKHFPCPSSSGIFSSVLTFSPVRQLPTSSPAPTDAANTRATATLLNLDANGNATVNQCLSTDSDEDWFTFTTSSTKKNVRVTLDNLPYDYDLRLYKGTSSLPVDNPSTPLYPYVTKEVISHNSTTTATYFAHIKKYYSTDYTPNYMYTLTVNTNSTGFNKTEVSALPPVLQGLTLYPNPTQQTLNLLFQSQEGIAAKIQIIDFSGKTAMQQQINTNEGNNHLNLDVGCLSKGLYIVQLSLPNEVYTQKLIIY